MEDTSSAVADAPSSTPSSSPTTTATPSAEPTVTTDRPSFKDALSVFNEQAKQQGKKPRGQTPAPSSPANPSVQAPAAIAPEGTADASTPSPARPGFIATADHIKAVENARVKARTEFQQQYGDVATLLPMARQYATDRRGFIASILQEGLQDPDLAPQIKSLAGQMLRGQQPQRAAAPTVAEPPQPDFQDDKGNQFYSAKAMQARDQYLIDKVKAEILGEVEPDLQESRMERQQRQEQEQIRATQREMQTHLTKARNWPHFKEHEPEIKALLAQAPLTSGHPAEEALLLREVYDRVVMPKLSALEQKRINADLLTRAHASTLNPASTGAPSGIPKNVTAKTGGSMKDAMAWALAQSRGQ